MDDSLPKPLADEPPANEPAVSVQDKTPNTPNTLEDDNPDASIENTKPETKAADLQFTESEPVPTVPLPSITPEVKPLEPIAKPAETSPEPATAPTQTTTPPPVESVIPKPTPTPAVPASPQPVIDNHIPIAQNFDVTLLTNEQLKQAATLYTKRNQAEFSRKGVAKRQQTMELNLREIVDFLSLNNGSPLPRIAKHTNITSGTTSKYLRQLTASGKVRAKGWGKTRRYYLNN